MPAYLWPAALYAFVLALNVAVPGRWVTGYVVHHSKMVETMQTWPLAARAGIEAPGVMSERGEKR